MNKTFLLCWVADFSRVVGGYCCSGLSFSSKKMEWLKFWLLPSP